MFHLLLKTKVFSFETWKVFRRKHEGLWVEIAEKSFNEGKIKAFVLHIITKITKKEQTILICSIKEFYARFRKSAIDDI